MVDTIATTDDLQARLDWTMDSGELGVAQGTLDDLSDDARYYGDVNWDSGTAPRQVKNLILRAAARYMRNPDGYTQSRAGDEMLQWADGTTNNAAFNAQEITMLGDIAGRSRSTVHSVEMVAYDPKRRKRARYINPHTRWMGEGRGDVYVQGENGQLIPFYSEDDPFGPEFI